MNFNVPPFENLYFSAGLLYMAHIAPDRLSLRVDFGTNVETATRSLIEPIDVHIL
jgi:hypothetical protein